MAGSLTYCTLNAFPAEVWELIFSQLPVTDLYRCHSLVCKRWYDIIAREQYLPWKKLYYKLKSERVPEAQEEIERFCSEANASCISDCLSGLISYLTRLKYNKNSCLKERLKFHPKYNCAVKLLCERFSDTLNTESPAPWSIIGLLCVIANNMWEIYQLFSFLTHWTAECTAMEILEGLYCIASFLLHFQRKYEIPSRLHYQVYYALYLYENSWTAAPLPTAQTRSSLKGQQAITRYTEQIQSDKPFTHEQKRIVNHQMVNKEIIKIVAFAGSGKTTTLKCLTQSRPSTRFLLIVYNKSTRDNAAQTFPPNTKCYTAHGLAFQPFGVAYRHKFTSNLKAYDIIQSGLLPQRKNSMNHMARAGLIVKTVTKFLNSADEFITTSHVPEYRSTSVEGVDNVPVASYETISDADRLGLASDAALIWEAMKDKGDLKIRMPHDGYLKLWQLSKPNLMAKYNVDVVLVDEGQDLNPAMLDVVQRQDCPRLIVGDPHQQIYQFRDAVNALNMLETTKTFYLTQSFRFGPEIGFVANSCLEALKGVTNTCLVGGKIQDQLGTGEDKFVNKKEQVAVIARTNFCLFKEAITLLLDNNSQPRGPNVPRLGFAGVNAFCIQ